MAELRKHVAETRLGLLAPAILVEVRAGGVVIDAASGASDVQSIFLPAEASALSLGDGVDPRRSALRDQVDRAAERVPPEDRPGPAVDLDAFDVVERDQVEIDLLRRRL